jgi:hypothetical protein
MPAATKHICAPFSAGFACCDAFLGGAAADLGPRTGAQALGDLRPQLDAPFGRRSVQRLRVGVGDEEIDALDACRDHVCDGIAARAADADHRDARREVGVLLVRDGEVEGHVRGLSWKLSQGKLKNGMRLRVGRRATEIGCAPVRRAPAANR